jgi:hypothetical protein
MFLTVSVLGSELGADAVHLLGRCPVRPSLAPGLLVVAVHTSSLNFYSNQNQYPNATVMQLFIGFELFNTHRNAGPEQRSNGPEPKHIIVQHIKVSTARSASLQVDQTAAATRRRLATGAAAGLRVWSFFILMSAAPAAATSLSQVHLQVGPGVTAPGQAWAGPGTISS